jgi:uncharacterized RDD family membrane protein YckC
MKKKLVVATLGLIVIFSSVISVVSVTAFVRDMTRHSYVQELAWARTRAQFLAAQAAQAAQVPQPPQAPAPDAPSIPIDAPDPDTQLPVTDDFELYARSRSAVRLGQNLTVGPDDVVRDALVVFGNATIAGRVTGDVVVIFGSTRILSTAVIDRNFVSVGGTVTVEEGATARRDVVVIGGPLDAPAGFIGGGEHIVVGSGVLGEWMNQAVPYLSRGPLWGRPIVPDLPWIWGVVALIFLFYSALNLIFDRPVRAAALTLRTRPLTAFGAGLLVLLLIGPICVLLAVSVIGIAVVPFVICAVIAAGVIGKVAVTRWIGMTAVEEEDENRAHAARSFVIGFAVLTIVYMIPVLGIITWAIVGVLGLGASAITFMAAYRRENPVKVRMPAPGTTTPPPPMYPPAPVAEPHGAAFDGSAAAIPTTPPPLEATQHTPPPAAAYAGGGYASAAYAYAPSGLLIGQPRALFRDRLAAFVIDVLVLFVAVFFLDAINLVDAEAFFPALLIYMIVSWTWKQTTFGGVICQIRLVRTDGAPLSFADALVRALAGIFSLAVLAIGALWILRDPERQAWHDKIAGTYVVKVPRSWPV